MKKWGLYHADVKQNETHETGYRIKKLIIKYLPKYCGTEWYGMVQHY
jgi:hypothetical protein